MHNKNSIRSRLLEAIESYCAEHSMSESRLGVLAVNDSHFVSRLREGRGRLSTLEAVEQFVVDGQSRPAYHS